MERAVLLSDIEFLEGVHESDWERIEEDSFLVNVSMPLNENQQIVLDYLTIENKLTKEAPLLSINNFAQDHFGAKLPEKVEKAYRKLNVEEDYQVLAAFAEWGMKNDK
ncbi:hypothetical protein [uncultured Enterococcus sp.]|jgi:hypothetical protein|uniref:hypothetical protein n=1 Tax=uncultured Enterococcus sp. TaxID=167972 RepID=UPI00205A185C|nr:hypothetical protein [uncultured Enterococcus sp.]DAL95819.1 MAG TPA: hypothetical protein [Caudoviricetes sp.]